MAGIITITINVDNDDYFEKSDVKESFESELTDFIVGYDGEIDEDSDILIEFTKKPAASSALADNDLN